MKYLIITLFFPAVLAAQSQPNIIFIMADDLGNGEISRNGTLYETPRIDTLASNGAYFNRFYVHPVCTPTRGMLMTGRYSFRHELQTWYIHQYSERSLPATETTLAQRLKERGYSTAVFGKWHLGHAHPENLPQARGFDYSFGNYWGGIDYTLKTIAAGDPTAPYDLHENGHIYDDDTTYYTELIGDKVLAWMDLQGRCSNTPFFAYVSFTAPHAPLQAPADTVSLAPPGHTADQKTKWAMIRIMDNEIGRIVDKTVELGIDSNTIIIFTSDNGALQNAGSGDNTPYSGWKTEIYEGGQRVPFIWYHPGTISPQTVDSVTHIIDIVPTFIEGALSKTIPAGDSIDGINIYPLITGGSIKANRAVITHLDPDRCWSVVRGDYKLVNNIDSTTFYNFTAIENVQLFNIATDSGETTDISGSNPTIVAELTEVKNSWVGRVSLSGNIVRGKPVGWVDFNWVGDPKVFYNSSYYYFR